MKDMLNSQGLNLLQLRMRTSFELLTATLEQWSMFQVNNHLWMGNIQEMAPPQNYYVNLPEFGLKLIVRSIQGVTWNRTQQLVKIERIKCCEDADSKERCAITKFIKE